MELSANLHRNESLGDRIIKVNHAGEHGAVNIYRAQLLVARYTAPSQMLVLAGFLEHEQKHRNIFELELARRGQRRCRSYMLCGIGGYVLGLLTGLFGKRAIGATTYAIENVVLKHLQAQVAALGERDSAAVIAIQKIVDEEEEHKEHYAETMNADRIWRAMLLPIFAASTEAVIWIGMHI
jgi:ubiquinone biosynthesis monooxygenase Coq7